MVLGKAFRGNFFEPLTHVREELDHLPKIVARDPQNLDVVECGTRCRAEATPEQANFAEKISAREVREDELTSGIIFGNLHESEMHDIEVLGRATLPGNALARRVTLEHDVFFQVFYEFGREIREHGHAADMTFQSAAAVIQIDLRAERFILQHDIENVPQHLKSNHLRFRTDGGGTRVKIHASHFPAEIARAEISDGIAVGKVHRGIDGDGFVTRLSFALVLFTGYQAAGEPFEETLCATVSPYV